MTSELDFKSIIDATSNGLSIPPAFYSSTEITEYEIEKIFRRKWICVGRTDLVRAPGDYVTLDIAKQQIILLRDQKNNLRALANTCRHRNARLLEGAGQCKGLRCPFHSWFYGLDGTLISAPEMSTANGFDKSNYNLRSYLVEERFGFVFISANPKADNFDNFVGNFSDLHSFWPIEELISVRRREFTIECNWKLFLEVFNEYYHLPFVHPNSVDSIYCKPKAGDLVKGEFATQFGKTHGTGGLLESNQEKALPNMPRLNGPAKSGARYTWLFPNMTFAISRDALWCYEAYPIDATSCKVLQTSCFHPESVRLPDFAEKSAAYLERLDAALDEDIPALLNQQIGMSCPDALSGKFQPELEANVASFARWYARMLNWQPNG